MEATGGGEKIPFDKVGGVGFGGLVVGGEDAGDGGRAIEGEDVEGEIAECRGEIYCVVTPVVGI